MTLRNRFSNNIEDLLKEADEVAERVNGVENNYIINERARGVGACAALPIVGSALYQIYVCGAAEQHSESIIQYSGLIALFAWFAVFKTYKSIHQQQAPKVETLSAKVKPPEELFDVNSFMLKFPGIEFMEKLRYCFQLCKLPEFYFAENIQQYVDAVPHLKPNPWWKRVLMILYVPKLQSYNLIFLPNVGITTLDQYGEKYSKSLWVHDGTGSMVISLDAPPRGRRLKFSPLEESDFSRGDFGYSIWTLYETKMQVSYLLYLQKSGGNFRRPEELKETLADKIKEMILGEPALEKA